MKFLKVFLLIIVAMFTFGSAMAQVAVRARVGGPYPHHFHHHHIRHHRYHHR